MEFSHTIGAKVSEETYKQVQLVARERECTPSDVVREALSQYLNVPSQTHTRENSTSTNSNQGQFSWTHSFTRQSAEDDYKSQPMAQFLKTMQARKLQNIKDAKLAGDALGGLVLLASVFLKCK